MPIGEQTTIASHTVNGVATVFAYSFGVLAADDIKVLVDGVVVTTGFTVSGIGSRTGGTVTFSVAPTSGADILIVRELTGGVYFGEPKEIVDLGNGMKGSTLPETRAKELAATANTDAAVAVTAGVAAAGLAVVSAILFLKD